MSRLQTRFLELDLEDLEPNNTTPSGRIVLDVETYRSLEEVIGEVEADLAGLSGWDEPDNPVIHTTAPGFMVPRVTRTISAPRRESPGLALWVAALMVLIVLAAWTFLPGGQNLVATP